MESRWKNGSKPLTKQRAERGGGEDNRFFFGDIYLSLFGCFHSTPDVGGGWPGSHSRPLVILDRWAVKAMHAYGGVPTELTYRPSIP